MRKNTSSSGLFLLLSCLFFPYIDTVKWSYWSFLQQRCGKKKNKQKSKIQTKGEGSSKGITKAVPCIILIHEFRMWNHFCIWWFAVSWWSEIIYLIFPCFLGYLNSFIFPTTCAILQSAISQLLQVVTTAMSACWDYSSVNPPHLARALIY